MKKGDFVIVSSYYDGEDNSLCFEVYNNSGIDELRYGEYKVSDDGFVSIQLDDFLFLFNKEEKRNAMMALKNNGLGYILGSETQQFLEEVEAEVVATGGYDSIKGKLERWEKAKKYIKTKNLDVSAIPMPLIEDNESPSKNR